LGCEAKLMVTLHGALTPAEKALAQSPAGAAQVQEFHRQFFTAMLTQPEFCEALLDRTLGFWLDWLRAFLDEAGDVIMIGDDPAGQSGPLFRRDFYRRVVRPRQNRLVQFIRSRTEAKIWYHTCGSCAEYIPDLLHNGIDILNPVRIFARDMNPAELKARSAAGWPSGAGDRRPARAPLALARGGPRARPAEPGGVEAARGGRVQQRPQHPGGGAGGEGGGDVRRSL
jgi:hypothetical protein